MKAIKNNRPANYHRNTLSPFFIFIGLFIFICLSFACEKIIYFDVDAQTDKLVLNCVLTTSGNTNAKVSLSKDPLDYSNTIEYVDNATVSLYKNNSFLSFLLFDSIAQNYPIDSALISAQADDVFNIEVEVDGKDPISAELKIPPSVPILSAEIIDTINVYSFGFLYDSLGVPVFYEDSIPNYLIEITFQDNIGANYYSLQTKYIDNISNVITCFKTEDPVFTFDNSFGFSSDEKDYLNFCSEVLFSDITFEATTKSMRIFLPVINADFFPGAAYQIILDHASKEYYQYVTSVNLQNATSDDPFANIVSVPSNISGGFGIFTATNRSIRNISL